MDLSVLFKDKALLEWKALKEKEMMLDAEKLKLYTSDKTQRGDEGPKSAVAFMANLSSTGATNNPVNEVHSNDNQIFDNVDYHSQIMQPGRTFRTPMLRTEIDDNTISVLRIAILTDFKPNIGHGKGIIKERTTQRPDYVSEWVLIRQKTVLFEQQLVPFYDHFKKHIQVANDTFFKEIKEFEQIFDELEAEYEQCVLDNKNLTIEKKNLLIINECLIAECLEKGKTALFCFTSDIVVPPRSNCLCEDLRSACDREHTKVLELEAEISKQKQLISESEKRLLEWLRHNSFRGKMTAIHELYDAQINIIKVECRYRTEEVLPTTIETDRIQLKDTITSLRIQLDGLTVENVSLKRRYDELSKANTHSRTTYTEKLNAFTAENTKLKAQVTGTTSSGPSTSETPKALAPGMYNLGVKPTSGASKTVPKRAPRNHSSLPVKSANARRVEAHHRTLNKKNRVDSNLLVKHSVSVSNLNNVCGACNKSLVFANHTDCLVMCDGSVNVKPHQTKRFKRQPRKEWKPIKRVWKPISKPVAKYQASWKPTA
ncbi:hypothetical protein Tco_0651717 [Tanacetum coccineum]|uniref:Uncharacterized protein n=1 Tax=Tanacetum coccineum TaxID=301880 RepID=A0ABQ4WVW0_9ASTR